jgi:hypothetical protein
MNPRGLAAVGTMCLAAVVITGCNDDKDGKGDVGKAADVKATGSARSPSDSPEQSEGTQQSNGTAELPPRQILEKAAQALETAPSWHVVTGDGNERIEFSIDDKGNCQGMRSDDGEEMEFLLRGESFYAKPRATFWENHFEDKASQAQRFVAGRYIRTTADDPEFSPLFCTRNMLRASLLSPETIKAAKLTKGAETVVDGVGTLQLKGTLDGSPTTVVVATTGEPYPMTIESSEAGTAVRMNFSEFGKEVAGSVPAPDDTVDVGELKQAVGAGD